MDSKKKISSKLKQNIAEKFTLESLIAEGGMGIVYKATQQPIGREVALKILTAPNTAEFRERFLREGATTIRLAHRHIVTVYDYGELNGELYIAMENLKGTPLSLHLVDRRLSVARSLQIGLQLCSALRVAHKDGIVHRDLKPGNIMMVAPDDFDGDFVKIIDFGIAKVFKGKVEPQSMTLTNPGTWVGSPKYMAPEQISQNQVDPRTDIYALGIILFEMMTGQTPFQGNNSHDIFEQHMRSPAPPLSELGTQSDLSPELELVIERCLEKKPQDRYQTVEDLASDLSATLRIMGLAPSLDLSFAGKSPPDITTSGVVNSTSIDEIQKPRTISKFALAVVLALPLLLLFWSKITPDQNVSSEIVTSTSDVAEVAVAALPEHIQIHFVSTPVGSTVVVNSKELGTTPFVHQFDRENAGQPLNVRINKEGFQELQINSILGQEPIVRANLIPDAMVAGSLPEEVEAKTPTQKPPKVRSKPKSKTWKRKAKKVTKEPEMVEDKAIWISD